MAIEQEEGRFNALLGGELHFRIKEAVGGAEFAIDLQLLVDQPVMQPGPEVLQSRRLVAGTRSSIRRIGEQRIAVKDERALLRVDARLEIGRLDELFNDECGLRRIDRQFERGEGIVAFDFRRRLFRQTVGVEHRAVVYGAVGNGLCGDARDGFDHVDLGIEQPTVMQAQIQQSQQQAQQAQHVGDENAP